MTQQTDCGAKTSEHLKAAVAEHPSSDGRVARAQAPGVADVMGGIVEESGSLVLTTTVGLSFTTHVWAIDKPELRIRLFAEDGAGPAHDAVIPMSAVLSGSEQTLATCRSMNAEWAAPIALVVGKAVTDGVIARPSQGFCFLTETDFPPDCDLGRHTVLATAALEALCRLSSATVDRFVKSKLCSESVFPLTGLQTQRTALTALAGPPDGSALQLRFHPQPFCEALAMPQGVIVMAVRTTLGRPVTRTRLIETSTCAEMGQRILGALGDGSPPRVDRLSAITPTEFVEYYRDVLPSKISGKNFIAKFGTVRGLNGTPASEDVYKVRSRAEHHIYENKRVQEFVALISRARRTGAIEALAAAGELMYASHWSHSQRCGIGGVETDRLVSAIRSHGLAAGLFGAKVTAGGAGGELVVLMRDTEPSHAALKAAIASAEALSNRRVHTYRGFRAGAEFHSSALAV